MCHCFKIGVQGDKGDNMTDIYMSVVQALVSYGALGVFAVYFMIKDYKLSKRINSTISDFAVAMKGVDSTLSGFARAIDRLDNRLDK